MKWINPDKFFDMNRPKLLMFGWEFPPHNSGGLGVACFGLSRALSRLNTEIIFVLPQKIPTTADFMRVVFPEDYLSEEIIRQSRLTGDLMLHAYVTSQEYQTQLEKVSLLKGAVTYASDLYGEVRRYGVLARAIAKKETFDVIHAHDWLSFPAGIEAKRVSGKPLIVHVHATEFDRCGGPDINRQVFEIEKEGLEKADGIVAISEFVKNNIIRNYGADPKKIRVIHNGVDEEDYATDPGAHEGFEALKAAGKKIVLFLGRITIQKGPDYFIEAAKIVLNYNPDVIFLVAGSGDMERQMIRKAAELGIGDKVIFTGFLRGKEWLQVFRSADLFVMPSVSEPFGLVALESMVNGTPVLISKQSGVSEVARNVLKTDFWDTEEMANKILAVLGSEGLPAVLKKEGFSEAREISWKEAAKKCIEFYNQLAQT
ncbi:MAG: glycosyltransferase family 4 protein [Candidatus Pacebacteria bacterium]|nr:glycosyltransferase family 4 protein [Candidatus Paceibacterota bacterium]MDR3582982.1 glycosyltransferase family 4 protein [Candidatus Paceibacterota bacterium]